MNLYGKDNRLSEELCPECGKPLTILNSVVYAKAVLKCYNPFCPINYPQLYWWRWFCPKCGEPKIRYDSKNHKFVCWNCLTILPEKDGTSLNVSTPSV